MCLLIGNRLKLGLKKSHYRGFDVSGTTGLLQFPVLYSQWIELLHIFSQKSVNYQWPIAGEVMIIEKSNIILLNN